MESIFAALLPVYLGFTGGFILKKLNILDKTFGQNLLKLVFYLLMPSLVFTIFAKVDLSFSLVIFSFSSPAIILASFIVSKIITKKKHYSKQRSATFIVSMMILNTAFLIPFIQELYGENGMAKLFAFDLMNAVLAYSIVYLYAESQSPKKTNYSVIKKLLRVPIIWAIILGLIANVASLGDDFFVIDSLTALGSITGTAVVIALGILFEPKYNDIADSILLIGSRYILGLAIFFIVLLSFELQTEEKAILLMLCTTPIPFNSAVYSSIFDLDTEFAIRSISLSIPFAIVSTSIIALVFGA